MLVLLKIVVKWFDGKKKILLSMCVMFLAGSLVLPAKVEAMTGALAEVAIGRIVEMNGLKFLKTDTNKYAMVVVIDFPEYMQDFTSAHCNAMPMPACVVTNTCTTSTDISTLYTQGPVLKDRRDDRVYEIRKYADGQCWMADDLKFGGTTSSVAGVPATLLNNYCTQQSPTSAYSTIIGNTNPSWFNVDENGLSTGVNLKGMCYNPGPMNEVSGALSTGVYSSAQTADPAVVGQYGWQYASSNTGYLYDWGAATQDAFTAGAVGARKVQGICPSGWHLPASDDNDTSITIGATPNTTSGNAGNCSTTGCTAASVSDFRYLDQLYGGTGGNSQFATTHAWSYFWGKPTNIASLPAAWKGTFPGCSGGAGCVSNQRGICGAWRTSASRANNAGIFMATCSGYFHAISRASFGYGWTVRCVAD